MACSNCDYKGYIETEIAIHAGFRHIVKQCLKCNDIKAYSDRIQQLQPKPSKPRFRLITDNENNSSD